MITILQNHAVKDFILFEMKENGLLLGSVSARIDDGTLVIFELESKEEIFYDGLVRSVLGYADNRCVGTARFDIDDERKLKRLRGFGFIPEDGKIMESIQAFFFQEKCN